MKKERLDFHFYLLFLALGDEGTKNRLCSLSLLC